MTGHDRQHRAPARHTRRGLPVSGIDQLFRDGRCTNFAPNDELIMQDRRGGEVWLLERGVVRVVAPTGDRPGGLCLAFRGHGALLGEMAALGTGKRSAEVFAVTNCTVRRLRSDEFRRACAEQASFAVQLACAALRQRHESELGRSRMAVTTAQARLADHLLRLSLEVWDSPRLEGLRRRDLGDLIGVTRTTVYEALNALRDSGAIRCGRGPLEILDVATLQRILHTGRPEQPSKS